MDTLDAFLGLRLDLDAATEGVCGTGVVEDLTRERAERLRGIEDEST